MVDVYQMLDMLTAWVDSKPKVRGYDIDDAELRLRHYGEGRIAVSLRPKNPKPRSLPPHNSLSRSWRSSRDDLSRTSRKRGSNAKGYLWRKPNRN